MAITNLILGLSRTHLNNNRRQRCISHQNNPLWCRFCVYMYIIHICIYAHIYVYIYILKYIYIHSYQRKYYFIHIFVCVHICQRIIQMGYRGDLFFLFISVYQNFSKICWTFNTPIHTVNRLMDWNFIQPITYLLSVFNCYISKISLWKIPPCSYRVSVFLLYTSSIF